MLILPFSARYGFVIDQSNTRKTNMTRVNVFAATMFFLSYAPVMAGGEDIPLPLAGAAGPVGVGVALAGYVGYRIFRKKD